MTRPLEGIRVLDLSQGAAGPWCAMLLGDLGAEIAKVEPPGGDWGRTLGPPFVDGVATCFLAMNRNKRGAVIDLKKPGGSSIVTRMASLADVVIENFRPGVVERLGIGYEDLSAHNPRLIYLSISAYGRTGPWRDRPGVDGVIQATSGIMSVTGEAGRGPVRVGFPVADTAGAMFGLQGVLAALLDREKTGQGQRVDVSLLQSALVFQLPVLAMHMESPGSAGRQGSGAPYSSPNEAYRTGDGYLMVAAYMPERWVRFCRAIGHPELAVDSRFDTNTKRLSARSELTDVIESILVDRSTAEWVSVLEAVDVMCAPVLEYDDLLSAEQLQDTEALWRVEHPTAGDIPALRYPAQLGAHPAAPQALATHHLGEHSIDILTDWGFSGDEASEYLAAGVITQCGSILDNTTAKENQND